MYCTVDSVRAIFEENGILDEAIISDTRIEEIITEMDAEIDGTLLGKYPIPFTTIPTLIKNISTSLSVADAMAWISATNNSAMIKPETMAYYKNEGSRKLESIASGKMKLTGYLKPHVASSTYTP